MLQRTALMLVVGLGLTGCASTPGWPPPPGSCIEFSMRWGRPSSAAYHVDGRRVSRTEVERIVYDTPELVRQGHQYRVLTNTGFVLIPSGFGTFITGALVMLATRQHTAFLPFALANAGAVVTGIILNSAPRDPIEDAIVAFNRDPQRHGYCLDLGRVHSRSD